MRWQNIPWYMRPLGAQSQTLRDVLRERLDALDDGFGPMHTERAPELCEQARRLIADPQAAEPEFSEMLRRLDHHYRQLTKHWSASNKAELERWLVKPLTVTMKELDIIMCGRHKSKTLKNKGLPEAVGTKGRATQYLYLDLVQMSGWNDLPSESEARKILRHQVSMSDSFRD